MIASLPMYDRPELRTAHDALWVGIRDALRDSGVDAPGSLNRDIAIWDGWQSPDLLLGQICGLPLRAWMHDRVQVVSTLDYGLPDTPAGHYRSAIILRRGDTLRSGARLAINDPLSHSGWEAAHHWSMSQGFRFGDYIVTRAHAKSAGAVAVARADLAFIDAITWRGLTRFEPDMAAALQVVGYSDATPGLALITAPGNDVAGLRYAVGHAVAALDRPHRDSLGLHGVVDIPLSDYLSVPIAPAPDIAIDSELSTYRAS